jgi:amidase
LRAAVLAIMSATTTGGLAAQAATGGIGVGYTDIGAVLGLGGIGGAGFALGGRFERVFKSLPDLGDAESIFLTMRAFRSAAVHGPLLSRFRDQLKPEAIWEIERGLALMSADVARAVTQHGQLLERVRRFQEKYEFLVCVVNQVPPFDATLDWPKAIDGVKMEHYVAWMKSAYWITVTFRPAISVPAGFTPDGLPVGLQIVGRHRDDFGVLQMAQAFEQATGIGKRRPV